MRRKGFMMATNNNFYKIAKQFERTNSKEETKSSNTMVDEYTKATKYLLSLTKTARKTNDLDGAWIKTPADLEDYNNSEFTDELDNGFEVDDGLNITDEGELLPEWEDPTSENDDEEEELSKEEIELELTDLQTEREFLEEKLNKEFSKETRLQLIKVVHKIHKLNAKLEIANLDMRSANKVESDFPVEPEMTLEDTNIDDEGDEDEDFEDDETEDELSDTDFPTLDEEKKE